MIYLILLAVHLIVCVLVFFGIKSGFLKVHKYMFFVALFLPFWGVLVLGILHFQIGFESDGGMDIGVEKLKIESELYKSITIDEKRVAATTVPIEEALLVNSAKERRSIIMDVLNDNPKEYIEFLQKAGNNEDTEVVHYAVTAMVEISKENDYMLQQLERRYDADPEDGKTLEEYTDFLWNCLEQNLMQGQVEVMNRELFSSLMKRKISNGGSITDYERLVTNELKSGNYTAAGEALSQMENVYPTEEEYYFLKLRYLAVLGRGAQIQAFINQVENEHIYMSAKLKEALAFWQE